MRSGVAEMRRLHHRIEGGFNWSLRIREERRDAGQSLVLFRIEDVEDRADQQRVARLFPMVPLVQRPFWVDQDVGDVLDVADLPFAAAHLEQRIVGSGFCVGRVEEQHAAVPGAEAGGELPVLALDVVNNRRARPGQQRGHNEANTLAASGGREAQNMFRPIMAQISVLVASQHDTIGTEKAGRLHLLLLGPTRRAIGLDLLGLACTPDRHADGDGDRDEATGRRDESAFDEDRGCVGVEAATTTRRRRVADRKESRTA